MSPAAKADLAFVTNQESSELSVVDLETGDEIRRISVPGNPAGVAVAETLGSAFVVAPKTKTLYRLSLSDGQRQAELDLDGGPIGVAVDEERARVFVTDWYNARIWVVNAQQTETLLVETTLTTGSAPAGIELSPDARWLVAADRDADQLSVFDAETLKPHRTIPVGHRPFGVGFMPDGRAVSVDVGSNTVTIVDPRSGKVQGQVRTGERPYCVTFAAGRGFVSNQYADTVTVFDLKTLKPTATIEVGEYPEGIDASSDGRHVVVANWFSNSLTIIDAKSLEAVRNVALGGDGPRAFGQFISGKPAPATGTD